MFDIEGNDFFLLDGKLFVLLKVSLNPLNIAFVEGINNHDLSIISQQVLLHVVNHCRWVT